MEKDETSSDDITNYYGSIKRMNNMFAVLDKTSELIEDIKQSDIYVEYKVALSELEKDPVLLEKADAFRKAQYEEVALHSKPLGFADASYLEEAYENISVYPEIDRFLKAELALCRLLQRIQDSIVEAIDFR